MKNILSTLLVVVILVAGAVGTLVLYQRAFEKEIIAKAPTPEEATEAISKRLVGPFTEAWRKRDVEILKSLTPSGFGGGLPVLVDWDSQAQPPFEFKSRSTMDELQRKSTTDFDVFFGYLLDRMFGLTNIQTFYQISESEPYTDRLADSWSLKLKLGASGINEQGGIVSYRSHQTVIAVIPDEDSDNPASLRSWEIRGEELYQTDQPVVERALAELARQGVEVDVDSIHSLDVTDFDGDDDVDLALQLTDGRRFVLAQKDDVYEDVTEALGIPITPSGDSSTARRTIWFDLNDDGRPDLISGDRVFENRDGKSFVDVTGQIDLNESMGPSGANSMHGLVEQFGADPVSDSQ